MKRSLLFLPGNNPNLLINGDVLGADAVIFDLEDAVAPDEKDAARVLVRNVLGALDFSAVEVIVRINPVDDSGMWKLDLDEVIPLKPRCVLATKARDADYARAVSAYMGEVEARHGIPAGTVKLIALIETAIGLENAFSIAAADPRVSALFLGAEDLTVDLRSARTKSGEEISYARGRIVAAARAASIDVYDTPFTDINDDDGITRDATLAKSFGFSGKAAISPRHVGAINRAFSPTQDEVDYARRVLEAIEEAKAQGKGAVSLFGKMIDAPIVLRAQQVIAMDAAIKGGTAHE
ncbi:MAG: CoA ester lyase [Treponema sp.]|nr:CoA ester lyase [Treponema sp.]